MTPLQRLMSRFPDAPSRFVAAGFAVLVLPPLALGPWVPFVDLVAFVGLNNFPPKLSAGPLHFSVFQFTYIVQHALSRAMFDLGMSRATQVLLLYLLQAAIFFGVTQFLLRRLIVSRGGCALALAAGVLAFWDGQFLWGGPLAFSLAAACIALVTAATFRDLTAAAPPRHGGVVALCVLAMMCHPFAFPFALVVLGLRALFIPAARLRTGALALGLTLFAWIIQRDSADAPAVGFTTLFGLPFGEFSARLEQLWTADRVLVRILFGDVPGALQVHLAVLGTVHALGFLAAPAALVLARDDRPVRFLAALTTAIALLYFSARDNAVISEWPQRVLSFHNAITFVAGLVLPAFLLRRRDPGPAPLAARASPAAMAAATALLAGAVWVQAPVLRLGREIERNYVALKQGILKTDFANAFVVMAGVENIRPFYLRAVPFLLFSDRELVARNLVFFTEWHVQFRHPTRLVEHWFDIGRPRMQGVFTCEQGSLQIRFEPAPEGTMPITLGNHSNIPNTAPWLARREMTVGAELLALGATRDAILHLQTAARLLPAAPEVQNNLSVALLRAGRHAEARAHAERAVALDPRSAVARANLAVLCVKLGELEDAARQFEAAIELQGNVADWHIELAGIRAHLGRREEAVRSLEAALRIEPGNAAAERELARLRAR